MKDRFFSITETDTSDVPENSFSVDISDSYYNSQLNAIEIGNDSSEETEESEISEVSLEFNHTVNSDSETDHFNIMSRNSLEEVDESSSNSSTSTNSSSIDNEHNFSINASKIDSQLLRKKIEGATFESFEDSGFVKGLASLFK